MCMNKVKNFVSRIKRSAILGWLRFFTSGTSGTDSAEVANGALSSLVSSNQQTDIKYESGKKSMLRLRGVHAPCMTYNWHLHSKNGYAVVLTDALSVKKRVKFVFVMSGRDLWRYRDTSIRKNGSFYYIFVRSPFRYL